MALVSRCRPICCCRIGLPDMTFCTGSLMDWRWHRAPSHLGGDMAGGVSPPISNGMGPNDW
eukprot:10904432-Prorocentrum_lima.AAC.1